jgi:hypothetical protein
MNIKKIVRNVIALVVVTFSLAVSYAWTSTISMNGNGFTADAWVDAAFSQYQYSSSVELHGEANVSGSWGFDSVTVDGYGGYLRMAATGNTANGDTSIYTMVSGLNAGTAHASLDL